MRSVRIFHNGEYEEYVEPYEVKFPEVTYSTLDKVREDLTVLKSGVSSNIAAYHIQQVIEKIFKAYLAEVNDNNGIYPRGHSLNVLYNLISRYIDVDESLANYPILNIPDEILSRRHEISSWEAGTRYAGECEQEEIWVSKDEINDIIPYVIELYNHICDIFDYRPDLSSEYLLPSSYIID